MKLSLSLRAKFLIGTVAITVAIGLLSLAVIRPILNRQLHRVTERDGLLVASHLASHSVTPMLTERYIDLDLAARDMLEDAGGDIGYIFYIDRHGDVVSHTFAEGFPVELQNANPLPPDRTHSIGHLLLGEEEMVDIAFPILTGAVGAVHIGFSENMVIQGVRQVVRTVTWILAAVVLLGGVIAAFFDSWIVRPIRDLTDAVTAAGQGNLDQRVPVHSQDELGRLARSFNEAFELRKQALEEREEVIGKLNASLAKVKQLSGMLPICSSCKKVRDDNGYWSQIESYIRDRSEAEFSHSLCPECTRKLYPQIRTDV